MKKLLLLFILFLSAVSLHQAKACDEPRYRYGCRNNNPDGSQTMDLNFDIPCASSGSSHIIRLFIRLHGMPLGVPSSYLQTSGTGTVTGGFGSFLFSIPSSQALAEHICDTIYYTVDDTSKPWTVPDLHSFVLCPCPTGGCYTTQTDGFLVIKLNTPAAGPSPLFVWATQDGVNYDNFTEISGSPVLNSDGVSYDHLLTAWGYGYNDQHDTCMKIWYCNYSAGYSADPPTYATEYTICPCPTEPVTSCVQANAASGNSIIKLVFPAYVYSLYGAAMTAWVNTGSGFTAYTATTISPDGGNYNYFYEVPSSYIDTCTPVYFYYADHAGNSFDPQTFAHYITVCPCCPSFIRQITLTSAPSNTTSFEVNQPATWWFSDGGSATGAHVTHSFTGAGPYVACATSINADGSTCNICDTICLDTDQQTGHGDPGRALGREGAFGHGDRCDPQFAIVYEHNTITVWPGPYPSITSPSGTFYWSWGDGATVSGVPGTPQTHTYPLPGIYTICVTRVILVPGGGTDTCNMCYNICLYDTAPPPPLTDTFKAMGGCIDQKPGSITVKLVFSNDVHATLGNNIYIWGLTGAGAPSYLPSAVIADGPAWDYIYTIPVISSGPCYTIFYSGLPEAPHHETNPAVFARSIYLCPCCGKNIKTILYSGTSDYTATFQYSQPASWSFSDGGTDWGTTVTHTFTGPAPYTVCATSDNADGSKCTKCDTLCFAENEKPKDGDLGSMGKGDCDPSFAIVIDHNHVELWPGPDPFWVSPTGTFFYTWGDGTTISGIPGSMVSHTYMAPGTYTICLTRVIKDPIAGTEVTCKKCFNICIAFGTPVTSGGCTNTDGTDVLIKLVFNNAVHSTYGTSMYLWSTTGGSPVLPTSVAMDPDGINWDYFYSVPVGSIPGYNADSCFQVYYYNKPSGPTGSTNPAEFASVYTLCPCCKNIFTSSYTIGTMYTGPNTVHFTSSQVCTWDFGDGGSGTGSSVDHTYGAGGQYIVCAKSMNADGTTCEQCDSICVADPQKEPIDLEPGKRALARDPRECDPSFALIITGLTVTGWPGPDPFWVSPTGMFEWNWGDGTSTTGVPGSAQPHTYAAPGTYTICIKRTLTFGGDKIECVRCLTICVKAPGNIAKPAAVIHYSDEVVVAPNPATDITKLTFQLKEAGKVDVAISDEVGHIVYQVDGGYMTAGKHDLSVSTAKLSSGIYFIKLHTASGVIVKRLSVLK